MIINWKATVAQLDAAPGIESTAGQSVLTRLRAAGSAYDSAGKPDVHHESSEHRNWMRKKPSQRVGTTEPPFYVAAYYTKVVPAGTSADGFRFKRVLTLDDVPDQYRAALTLSVIEAFTFWSRRDMKIARRILVGSVVPLIEAERAERLRRVPPLGAIESDLVSSMAAAEAWLEEN